MVYFSNITWCYRTFLANSRAHRHTASQEWRLAIGSAIQMKKISSPANLNQFWESLMGLNKSLPRTSSFGSLSCGKQNEKAISLCSRGGKLCSWHAFPSKYWMWLSIRKPATILFLIKKKFFLRTRMNKILRVIY